MAFITSFWILDGVIALTTLIIAAYLHMTRKFKYWERRGVLEIPPVPFLGNFMDCLLLKKSPGYFLKDLYDQSIGSSYVGFYILDKPSLLVRDRELIKNILIKDFNYFTDRYGTPDVKDRIGYANLFFLKNPAWKILRAKLTPFFTSGKLKKMFELMLECANNLETHLNVMQLENKGKIVDMKEVIAKFTTDMIGITAFGLNVNSLSNPDAEFRKYGKQIFEYNYFRAFELFGIFFVPAVVSWARFKVFSKETGIFLQKVFWETINARVASGDKRNDLIDLLIELKETHRGQDIGADFKFDGDDLVAQAITFFAGGFETSSSTTSFALYELAVHLEMQKRLREEIANALNENNNKISYDMIMSLPYLDMVISEAMRLYPILPFLDRRINETYKVPDSDLVLEKDTPIYVSMLGMHRDPKYFPNPDKFDPERFNEENKRNIPSCVYFPFGEGPRSCVGARLGLLQAKLGLMKILTNFEVTPCEKTLIPMVLDPKGTTTTPLGGHIYLNIRRVNTNTEHPKK